jgi:uncharacterized protein (UPF0248 family)
MQQREDTITLAEMTVNYMAPSGAMRRITSTSVEHHDNGVVVTTPDQELFIPWHRVLLIQRTGTVEVNMNDVLGLKAEAS